MEIAVYLRPTRTRRNIVWYTYIKEHWLLIHMQTDRHTHKYIYIYVLHMYVRTHRYTQTDTQMCVWGGVHMSLQSTQPINSAIHSLTHCSNCLFIHKLNSPNRKPIELAGLSYTHVITHCVSLVHLQSHTNKKWTAPSENEVKPIKNTYTRTHAHSTSVKTTLHTPQSSRRGLVLSFLSRLSFH